MPIESNAVVVADAATVLTDVRRRVSNEHWPVLLGIVGPPGAGKTFAAERTKQVLLAEGCLTEVLPMDGFHLSNLQLDQLELRGDKGAPATFDVGGFAALLNRVRTNDRPEPIFAPDYDRDLHEPVAARRRVDPGTAVVIVEGNYLLHDAPGWIRVREGFDLIWYLDTPDHVREERLIARQVAGGRSTEEAIQWVQRVDAANAALVAKGRRSADYATDATLIETQLR